MGFKTVAMVLREGARALDDPQIAQEARLAVVFGNEGYGLSETDIDEADYVVCIPMSHGVDSLNVAHTASIAFWQLRQR
jgi:tRNA G18 (ribose-2'-O)-methylase SpoU